MTYRVLPDPRDLDATELAHVIEFCRANGIDATRVPAPQGDPGYGFQIHGDTIRFREWLFNTDGQVVLDLDQQPRITDWAERPLVSPPENHDVRTRKVRA